jgi:uncharacterized membrane protein
MRNSLEFIKTTAIGGLLVILPLAIILFVAGQILFVIYSTSYAVIEFEHMPAFVKNNPLLVVAGAFGLVVGACFLTGLVVQTTLGQYLRRIFKDRVIDRIPVIRAVTRITERFAGVDGGDDEFVPVEVDVYGDGIAVIGLLVERLPDDRCAVFVPTSPVTTVGNVLIVSPDKMRLLDAGISDAISAVSQWGVDTTRMYAGAGRNPELN